MRQISDNSRSNSESLLYSKDGSISEDSGWNTGFEVYFRHESEARLVTIANRRANFEAILHQYSVELEYAYNSSGWDYKARCPSDDHHDKTPSFGYNSKEKIFNCFGCHRNGGAVDFISYMEDIPKIDIIRKIIGDFDYEEYKIETFDYKKLQVILLEFANDIREFKLKNNNSKNATAYANAVTWNLDVYLRKNAPNNTIILGDLEVRIEKLKEQLKMYEAS